MDDDLTENYSAYDGVLGYGQRPALILVDFVQAYFDETCDLYAGVEDELASALRVREAARVSGIPVIYTNVVYKEDGADGGVFFRKAPVLKNFVAGNPMGEWPAGLQPGKDEWVISKQYPSAFFGTDLASRLEAGGRGHIDHHRGHNEWLYPRNLRGYHVLWLCSDCGRRCLR